MSTIKKLGGTTAPGDEAILRLPHDNLQLCHLAQQRSLEAVDFAMRYHVGEGGSDRRAGGGGYKNLRFLKAVSSMRRSFPRAEVWEEQYLLDGGCIVAGKSIKNENANRRRRNYI